MKYLKALLAKREAQAREGFVLPARMKWATLADEWLRLEALGHADGGERATYAVNRLKEHFGKTPIGEMLRKDLLEYIKTRGKKIKESTLSKEVATFRQIWKYAKASDYVNGNPWEGITVSSGLPPIKMPITEEEEERLFNALPKKSRHIYRFLLLTGCRGIEARFARKSDVKLEQRIVWVSGKTRKGDVEKQAVHLSDEAIDLVTAALESPRNETEWLFPNICSGKPYTTLRPSFEKAVVKAKLTHKMKGVHDLRHLFVSRLILAHTDLITASNLSRHKSLRMLKRYTHLTTSHLQEALHESQKLSNYRPTIKKEAE
jgi:integrase